MPFLDLSRYSLTAFGDPITWTPSGGQPVSVTAVVNRTYLQISQGKNGVTTNGTVTSINVSQSQCPGIKEGDAIFADQISWIVKTADIQRDGMVTCVLRKA